MLLHLQLLCLSIDVPATYTPEHEDAITARHPPHPSLNSCGSSNRTPRTLAARRVLTCRRTRRRTCRQALQFDRRRYYYCSGFSVQTRSSFEGSSILNRSTVKWLLDIERRCEPIMRFGVIQSNVYIRVAMSCNFIIVVIFILKSEHKLPHKSNSTGIRYAHDIRTFY